MLNNKQVNEFKKTGIIKIKHFFNKEEITKLKENLITKLIIQILI